MEQLYPLLLLVLLVIGCSKSNSIDPITEHSSFLVSNSSSVGKWKLTSLKVGANVRALIASQLNLTYTTNGTEITAIYSATM